MPFHRSASACFMNFGSDIREALQKQQMNTITSFMDASVVYGHTVKLENSLRDLSSLNGKLAINNQFKDPKGRPYLPFVPTLPSMCRQDSHGERVDCFSAGDSRVNEGLPLTTLHTLWLREHNRIAEALKHLNDHWSPETVYQETRKIIGALHQVCGSSFIDQVCQNKNLIESIEKCTVPTCQRKNVGSHYTSSNFNTPEPVRLLL